ncbi:MAG TPA: SAM-dependent methyltransferase [Candidatus Saccharimonadales bacterium]|nr:SAM-dependent methyltransferase [Candidatus Saccharimonadales bacterium]
MELMPAYHDIRTVIETKGGPLTFAEFMQISLYGQHGFYASGNVELNATGGSDFITTVEASPFLGIAITNWLQDRQPAVHPHHFSIVEPGAGSGIMARTILDEIGARYPKLAAVDYTIVELAPGMIRRQQEILRGYPVQWVNGSATSLPLRNIKGAIISDELPDAFPVHWMVRRGDSSGEIYINLTKEGCFYELEGPVSSERLAQLTTETIRRYQVEDGEYFTINPLANKCIQDTLGALAIGSSALIVDYGYPEGWRPPPRNEVIRYFSRLGDKSRRLRGVDRQVSYQWPGKVDMTSDVDFGALTAIARSNGAIVDFAGTQAEFMEAYGNDAAYDRVMEALKRGERSPGGVFEKRFAGYMRYMEGEWQNDYRPTLDEYARIQTDGWGMYERGKPITESLVVVAYTKRSDQLDA